MGSPPNIAGKGVRLDDPGSGPPLHNDKQRSWNWQLFVTKSAHLGATRKSRVHEGGTMYLLVVWAGKVTFLVWLAYSAYSAVIL